MCRLTQKDVLKEFKKWEDNFARQSKLKDTGKNGEDKTAFLANIQRK